MEMSLTDSEKWKLKVIWEDKKGNESIQKKYPGFVFPNVLHLLLSGSKVGVEIKANLLVWKL